MDALARFPEAFKLAGTLVLEACPVCGSSEIGELWRLPQTRLPTNSHLSAPGSRADGFYIDYLPLLTTPQEIYRFDICGSCESIFLNPKDDDQAVYVRDKSKVRSFKEKGTAPLAGAAKLFLREMPADAQFVVELACGAGQVLHLMREARPDLKLLGMELSQPSVDFMRDELGLDAYQVDLDRDDLDPIVAPGSADFVIAQEAFEHVREPTTLVKKMARMLKPGGRAYLTAQFWGDNELQIRVGEPIYINDKGLDYVVREAGLKLVSLKKDVKMRIMLEKPGGVAAPASAGAARQAPAKAAAAAPAPKKKWFGLGGAGKR